MNSNGWNRRDVLKGLGAASTIAAIGPAKAVGLAGAGEMEVRITNVSAHTFRLSVLPVKDGSAAAIGTDGSLVNEEWGEPAAKLRAASKGKIAAGGSQVEVTFEPVTATVANAKGETIQKFSWDDAGGTLSFLTGTAPLLGLGEGGAQFDRRGAIDLMKNGQGGYRLETHGARVGIPWLISTSGWAVFFHQPHGTFDLSGATGKFQTTSGGAVDLFFVNSADPAVIMGEYARLTGYAELPALWTLGYQQSHRTLASREEILGVAKAFREKKLPCDTLIYLSTGFCPSGWNTENGSFVWNDRVFPDPTAMLEEMHRENFHAVVHVVILSDKLEGTVRDGCELARFDETKPSCYWDAHRKVFAQGVDGWWPDEGDPLDIASRLTRNRMYWEGPQIDRPNERPYALHRNGYAGMQRYASFLWSGDVFSRWETLKTHVPLALNTALTGVPYWGTDIGGFVPTPEFTAELYVRWFQFGSFCPLFRCHGRAWKLRLPWGWNTGETGPTEVGRYEGVAVPDASQLHDARVEPICKKYLELRYKMMPYLYSTVRECAKTGMPVMRALWLHYPDDPQAVACGDEYLWGKNVLVAPVVEKGATSRKVYLPKGGWYDFWTGERVEGGREVSRTVDLETIPIYVRAGAIVPMGPVKQYVEEKVEEPLTVTVYPGADAEFFLYEDDGKSFDYRKGEWMGILMKWDDGGKKLEMRLADASKMIAGGTKEMVVQVGGMKKNVRFEGKRVEVVV